MEGTAAWMVCGRKGICRKVAGLFGQGDSRTPAGIAQRPAKVAHGEGAAEAQLQRALPLLGLNVATLKELPSGAPEKVVLAWWLRQYTTVSLRWVSERLRMGHCTRVTQAISRASRQPNRRHKQLKQKLREITKQLQKQW